MKVRTVVRTYLVLVTGIMVAKAIAFVSGAVLGRTLGATGLGEFGVSITALGYALVLTNFGLDALGTKIVAGSASAAANIAAVIRGTRLTLALGLGIVGGSFAIAGGYSAGVVIPLACTAVALAFRDDWLLFALGRDRIVSAGSVVRELAYLGFVASLVARDGTVAAAAWSYLAADTVWAIYTQAAARRCSEIGKWKLSPLSIALLKKSWPIAALGLMSLTYSKVDTLLIALIRGPADAGVYYAGYGVLFGALSLSSPFTRAAIPEMARARVRGGDVGMPATLRVSLLGAVMGCVVAAGISSSAAGILELVYGHAFSRGGEALAVLTLSLTATFAYTVLQQRLIVDDREGKLTTMAAIAVVTNVGLNLVLIPRAGIVGAAWATVATEFVLLGLGVFAHRRADGIWGYAGWLTWILIAMACGAVVTSKLQLSPWPVRGLIASLVVAAMCSPVFLKWLPRRQ